MIPNITRFPDASGNLELWFPDASGNHDSWVPDTLKDPRFVNHGNREAKFGVPQFRNKTYIQ